MGDFYKDYASFPGAYEALSVTSAATPLTAATYTPAAGTYAGKSAYKAKILLEGGDIRYRVDGGAPVAGSTGMIWPAASYTYLVLEGWGEISQFSAISESGATVTAHVTYYFVA